MTQGADPSVLVAALRLRHGARRHPRDAPAGDRGGDRRCRRSRSSPTMRKRLGADARCRGGRPGRPAGHRHRARARAHPLRRHRYSAGRGGPPRPPPPPPPHPPLPRPDAIASSQPPPPPPPKMKSAFEAAHKSRFGFIDESKQLVIEAVSVEAVGGGAKFTDARASRRRRTHPLPRTGADDPLLFWRALARGPRLHSRPAPPRPTRSAARRSSSSRTKPSWSRTAGRRS